MKVGKNCLRQLNLEIENLSSRLEAFSACRLMLSGKNSGLRPIGVGEGLRRITGKVIALHVKKCYRNVSRILSSLRRARTCVCESLIHAMSTIYEEQSAEEVGRCIKRIQICLVMYSYIISKL